MATNFEITCPCCDATIVIDRISGDVLLHKAKEKKGGGSLESMVAGLESQKSEMEKKFDKEMASQKDRARILEERFKEALQRAEKADKPLVNPMDLD
ncbi:MAG: 2-nitropropane dioxygenase [Acidobacteriota bacterium]|nr:2-nitropropane dioxygenase [Acidobacteriota bacterium]